MSIFNVLSGILGGGQALPAIEHDAFVDAVAKRKVRVIDVREPAEFAAGHIPGAENHPLSQFEPARLPKEAAVVLVCQAGARSARALQQARAAGLDNVAHYAGGTGGWKAKGGAISR